MLTARSKIHFQNVEPADVAIDSIDDGALVDEDVIHLDDAGRSAGRRRRHEDADFLWLIRIGNVVGAEPAVEEGAEHDLVGLPPRRQRHILVDVVGAEFTGLVVDFRALLARDVDSKAARKLAQRNWTLAKFSSSWAEEVRGMRGSDFRTLMKIFAVLAYSD